MSCFLCFFFFKSFDELFFVLFFLRVLMSCFL